MYTVTVTTSPCRWCERAKEALTGRGLSFQVNILDTQEKVDAFKAVGFSTVPQVWAPDGTLIGGYTDLMFHLGAGA